MTRRSHRMQKPRHVLSGSALTLVLTLLVAGAVADQGWGFSAIALGVAALAIGGLHLIFPQGPLFALGVANGLAVYVCLYAVLGRAAFPLALDWARPLGFLLPVASFVAACWLRRRALLRLAEGLVPPDLEHLPRFARWLLFTAVVGVMSLATPINRLPPFEQSVALLTAMAVISGISAAAVRDVVRLLIDIAAILQTVTARLAHLAVPIATYISIFALLSVVFGCFYRIADGLSQVPLFIQLNQPARLDFSDALHFSVVTLATVGYGDIQPIDDGIRLLAAIQMLSGQLLLLFGFAEIMRSTPALLHEVAGSRAGLASREPEPGRAASPTVTRREVAGE
jgi:hypothetical protein